MKKRSLIIVMLVVATLILTLLPTVALANPPLDVSTWADPFEVKDGDETTVYINVTNNTGVEVMLTAYEVDGDLMQISEGGELLPVGESTDIAYPYIVDFGGSYAKEVDVTIYYDDNIGAMHAFADPAEIMMAPPDTTTGFSAKADKAEVNSGDTVTFTIKSENKGDTDYNYFTVFADGSEIDTFHLAPGEKKTTSYKKAYASDTNVKFSYRFEYDNFGIIEEETGSDSVSITMKAPEPSATDAPTPASTQAVQDATPTQAVQDAATPSPEAIAVTVTDDAVPPDNGGGIGTLAIVLIIVGAVLVAAVATMMVLMLRRKSSPEKIIKRDDSVL